MICIRESGADNFKVSINGEPGELVVEALQIIGYLDDVLQEHPEDGFHEILLAGLADIIQSHHTPKERTHSNAVVENV